MRVRLLYKPKPNSYTESCGINVATGNSADADPWLAQMPASEDEDTVGEVIRYTLDEIRFA